MYFKYGDWAELFLSWGLFAEPLHCEVAAYTDAWRRTELEAVNNASAVQTRQMRAIAHAENADMVLEGEFFVGTKAPGYEGDGHDYWLCHALSTVVELQADEVDAQGTKFLAGSRVVRAHYLEWDDEELEHYRVDNTQVVTIYTHHVRLANVEMTAVTRTRGRGARYTLSESEADRCLAIAAYL